MPPLKGWLQGSYLLDSTNAAAQRAINIYPEAIEAGDSNIGLFKGCPGLSTPLVKLPTYPLRALMAGGSPLHPADGSGGRMFAVGGSHVYEVFQNGSQPQDLGDVGNDGRPATLLPNGTELGIISNNAFWLHDGVTLARVSTVPPVSGQCSVKNGDPDIHAIGQSNFVGVNAGDTITIGQATCTVASPGFNDAGNADFSKLTLTKPWGGNDSDSLTYSVCALNGVVLGDGAGNFTSLSGDSFPLYGLTTILLDGVSVNVQSVSSPSLLKANSQAAGPHNWAGAPLLAAETGAYLDSVFVVAPPNSTQLQQSNLGTGKLWDGGDIAAKESYPDKIGKVYADHEELYVLGESRGEVWRGPGTDENFDFQRDPGACMNLGIAAPESMASFLDGVAWIGASLRGQPVAYYVRGYQPERVSTHAIEQIWKKYPTVADAVGFSYEMDGHEFWQISFPSGDAAWVYDRTASMQFGKPMWHERQSYDATSTPPAQHRHRAAFHCFVWGKHWVGDYASSGANAGNIYEMSPDYYEDNGQAITCVRTLPHISANRLRQFFTKLQLDLETGGQSLTITVDWSDDGGTNWAGGGSAFTYNTSAIKKLDRAVFWQLGSAEDRIFRITVTGKARKALLNAYLDVIEGIS